MGLGGAFDELNSKDIDHERGIWDGVKVFADIWQTLCVFNYTHADLMGG